MVAGPGTGHSKFALAKHAQLETLLDRPHGISSHNTPMHLVRYIVGCAFRHVHDHDWHNHGERIMHQGLNVQMTLQDASRDTTMNIAALPFVKWAGGKRSLIPYLASHFPDEIDTYWEPFVGGGAVFFSFANRIKRAYLSDTNEDLTITYQIVKTNVDGLIERLREHECMHYAHKGQKYSDGTTYYQRVRASEPISPLEVAARFIYLNKTCFNGLYRVNKSGQFNVPEGSYANPDICNVERLRKASKALTKATIKPGDFSRVVTPSDGDLIYCDPPYDGCFTNYQADGFKGDSQTRLRDAANSWKSKGAVVVLSNADTPAMRKLYEGYVIHNARAPRHINSKGDRRGAVAELIITSR